MFSLIFIPGHVLSFHRFVLIFVVVMIISCVLVFSTSFEYYATMAWILCYLSLLAGVIFLFTLAVIRCSILFSFCSNLHRKSSILFSSLFVVVYDLLCILLPVIVVFCFSIVNFNLPVSIDFFVSEAFAV